MNKNSSWLILIYILVGGVIIYSIIYSFDISVESLFTPKDKQSTTTEESVTDQYHTLSYGKSVTIKGIIYTFSSIISDTRCPPDDNTCTSYGEAEVEILVGSLGSAEVVRVSTRRPTIYANLSISIKDLTPAPIPDTSKASLKLLVKEIEL